PSFPSIDTRNREHVDCPHCSRRNCCVVSFPGQMASALTLSLVFVFSSTLVAFANGSLTILRSDLSTAPAGTRPRLSLTPPRSARQWFPPKKEAGSRFLALQAVYSRSRGLAYVLLC